MSVELANLSKSGATNGLASTLHAGDVPQSSASSVKSGKVDVNAGLNGNGIDGHAEEDAKALKSSQRTKAQIRKSHIHFLSLCFMLFVAGWNDGTTGPLIPRIQEVYDVNFTIVSLIFVFACLGFVGGALVNIYITDKMDFGKIMFIGAAIQIIAAVLQAPGPPFPVFVLAYALNGFGIAFQDAQANGYVGSLKHNAEAKMGIVHAAYGLGAFAAPFASTQFAQLPRWSFHFLISLGLAVINIIGVAAVFKFKSHDDCLRAEGEIVPERTNAPEKSQIHQVLTTRVVHLLAFFILIYVGVEVTIGGWIVTYIIEVRGGGPSSGYISSGFFGGLTLGRVVLLWVNKKVGEWRVIFVYAAISLGLEFIIWFVPSLIGNAVAVSIVGLLLGPMFPIAMNQASRILPRRILTSSIGWIAGFGQAGSAVLPFMTGAIANKHGISSLQPLLVAMMGVLILIWARVPRAERRTE